METFSALLAFCARNSPATDEFPSLGPMMRSFDVFFAWINGWVNNREAGDLRPHRTHYDVTVMNWETRLFQEAQELLPMFEVVNLYICSGHFDFQSSLLNRNHFAKYERDIFL